MPGTSEYLLLVEKTAVEPEGLADVLRFLLAQYGLDSYQARQRLLGAGKALLARGDHDRLTAMAAPLQQAGVAVWVVQPTRPTFAPARVREIRLTPETLYFTTEKGTTALPRGATVLAVLADLSGTLAKRHIKNLLAQNAYRGQEHIVPLDSRQHYRIILRAQPVLDVYLLDDDGRIAEALRFVPGRFNPQGLGERAGLSGAENLHQLVQLLRRQTDDFTLNTEFGLAQLPGCLLDETKLGEKASPENLNRLTLFGWRLADLRRAQAEAKPGKPEPEAGVAPLLAAVAGVTKMDEAAAETEPTTAPNPSSWRGLPPPPPDTRQSRHFFTRPIAVFFTMAAVGAGFALLMGHNNRLLGEFFRQGIRTGVLPALLSAILLASGFHFIRLKRLLENTPTSRIRSLALGMVEVHGRARRRYALVSPMTQSPCVYYRLKKYRRDDRNHTWNLVSTQDSGYVPFLLDDGSGRVIIDPQGARVRPKSSQEGYPGQTSLLVRGKDPDEKWVEELIHEGSPVYILGQAYQERSPAPTLRERTRAILQGYKQDAAKRQQFDKNRDGHLSPDEWDEARQAAEEEALHQALHATDSRGRGTVIIGRDPHRRLPFIIAETPSEAHLTRNYGLTAIPLFLAAVAAAFWSLTRLVPLLTGP
ncbi:E3 ubiquitin ligase family protein [Desulfuromonas sp. KJ2020]|uniref:E3 ubiquitin ligase family protein n=1 Tax=Desulfuromonas sp. KJ2020 TaxID=2919173 RepID=UPI0020A6F305|nr:E3 ubiquitin ligase family protein [Desulfuromonas sp. KJ2020]MCP3175951.1 E3 ubiquitin ligase family protein [Desulfuromonas sp. KJ2020]